MEFTLPISRHGTKNEPIMENKAEELRITPSVGNSSSGDIRRVKNDDKDAKGHERSPDFTNHTTARTENRRL